MFIQFGILILILTSLIIPAIFFIWLSRGSYKSKVDWLIRLLIVLSYSIYIFLVGRWDWLSYYLRFVLVILFFLAVFKSYKKTRNLSFNFERNFKNWLSLGTNFFVLIIFCTFNILAVQGYFVNEQPAQLAFPLQNGTYYVAHGGSSPIINLHNIVPAQRYALDIVKLNIFGTRARGLYPQELKKYAIFGETLVSPCDGKIQETANSFPDLKPSEMDRENIAGNHVLIECKEVDVLLAHLKKGSITLEKGEQVNQGQPIGQVGNSGNTSEPHLHIHAWKAGTENSVSEGKGVGVPMIFNNRFLVRNSLVN